VKQRYKINYQSAINLNQWNNDDTIHFSGLWRLHQSCTFKCNTIWV